MQLNKTYKEGIATLDVYGLPDNSLGHDYDTVGILLSWKLTLIGLTVLEGKKEHLVNLVYVIISYSHCCISGQNESISDKTNSVNISRVKEGHLLKLTSSKKHVDSLTVTLDDAELADLTRCLDKLQADNRIAVNWPDPLRAVSLRNNFYIKPADIRNLINPVAGISFLFLTAFLFINLPTNTPPFQSTEELIDKKESSIRNNK